MTASSRGCSINSREDASCFCSYFDPIFLQFNSSYIIGQIIHSVVDFHVNQLRCLQKCFLYILLRFSWGLHENKSIFLCKSHSFLIRYLASTTYSRFTWRQGHICYQWEWWQSLDFHWVVVLPAMSPHEWMSLCVWCHTQVKLQQLLDSKSGW